MLSCVRLLLFLRRIPLRFAQLCKTQRQQGKAADAADGCDHQRVALVAGRKTLLSSLILFYCLKDRDTPTWAKGVIVGALGYLILPADLIPDILPGAGYGDEGKGLLTDALPAPCLGLLPFVTDGVGARDALRLDPDWIAAL